MYKIYNIILFITVLIMIIIILQQGKKSNLGYNTSIGASKTIFGAKGSNNFLTKTILALITFFFITSLIIGNENNNKKKISLQQTNKKLKNINKQ